MNKNNALLFLKQHQPLPSDSEMSENLISEFDDVRKFFIEHPCDEAIPLFLRCFGDGDGFGVYQLVEDVFYKIKLNTIKSFIKEALEDYSLPNSCKYWTIQISTAFPDNSYRKSLITALSSSNEDIREAAEFALSLLEE
jgi:hypothetical protein